MPSTMTSRLAVLAALNAVGLAAPQVPSPSTTEAMQSFLSISDLDAVQAAQVSSKFLEDRNSYYNALTTDPRQSSASTAFAAAIPPTAAAVGGPNPEVFLASLARADQDDLPAWFTSMPAPVQDFWKSVGSQDIEMYTSEVNVVRPLASQISASLSSKADSASSSLASATASAVAKGAAPRSPATSGLMTVVGVGVAIAAGLVGMAML
ncbi:MAG: hypothetical protein LQ341_007370 [Variospora aurantia]|nr:MAG: hypothetical protein LQ341_007370 [Variospora aurantia]